MAEIESGIEYEATIYWTTALYIADAKRIGVYLTREDIDQIRANALRLNASRFASVRRCADGLPAITEKTAAAALVQEPAANEKGQRPKRARKKGPGATKLPKGVIRFRPRKKAAGNRGGGDAT